MATVKRLRADVLSVSPSSERLEELWVVLYVENGATLLVGIWRRENKTKLVGLKALVDTVGIKTAEPEDIFLF